MNLRYLCMLILLAAVFSIETRAQDAKTVRGVVHDPDSTAVPAPGLWRNAGRGAGYADVDFRLARLWTESTRPQSSAQWMFSTF